MEKNLSLLGCIALKDELADDVEETIKFIRHRNQIKFWIITGDKDQTVERIGKQIGIINDQVKTFHFEDLKKITDKGYSAYKKKRQKYKKKFKIVGVINGKFFDVINEYRATNRALYDKFVRLWMRLESCFFCRIKDH